MWLLYLQALRTPGQPALGWDAALWLPTIEDGCDQRHCVPHSAAQAWASPGHPTHRACKVRERRLRDKDRAGSQFSGRVGPMSPQAEQSSGLAESLETLTGSQRLNWCCLTVAFSGKLNPQGHMWLYLLALSVGHVRRCAPASESCDLFLNTVLSKARVSIRQRNQLFPELSRLESMAAGGKLGQLPRSPLAGQ